jgi:hypothetical protein
MRGQVGGSGLGSKPGVPKTGWREEDIEDLGGPDEICEWCPYNKHIRFVYVMSHPDWSDLVRVGSECAELMGDPYAGQREEEFRRDPVKWRTQVANGTLIDSKPVAVRDVLQRARAPSPRQDVWLHVIWFLVILAFLVAFLNPP